MCIYIYIYCKHCLGNINLHLLWSYKVTSHDDLASANRKQADAIDSNVIPVSDGEISESDKSVEATQFEVMGEPNEVASKNANDRKHIYIYIPQTMLAFMGSYLCAK